jgi:hypothetical protein
MNDTVQFNSISYPAYKICIHLVELYKNKKIKQLTFPHDYYTIIKKYKENKNQKGARRSKK